MSPRTALLLLVGVLSVGCGEERWAGTYATTQDLNVAGPLADGRSFADMMADFMIAEAVDQSPIPTKDLAKESLTKLFRDELAAQMVKRISPKWGPDGDSTKRLRASLTNVRIESNVQIEEGGVFESDVVGTETITAITFTNVPLRPRLDLAGHPLTSEWKGDDEDDYLEIDQHDSGISYGDLIFVVADAVVGGDSRAELNQELESVLECTPLVQDVFGKNEEVVLPVSFDPLIKVPIKVHFLVDACNGLRRKLVDKGFEVLFSAPIMVGGRVTFDGSTLAARPNEYGGTFRVLPESISPKILVTLDAKRR